MSAKKSLIDYKEIIENAWLDIDLSEYVLEDNLKPIEEDIDYYGRYLIRMMKNPEYIAYGCKQLLNLDILPEQAVVLSEFEKRAFPMFIGSRGFGKSFMLALYAMYKMALTPPAVAGGAGCKIVIAGAAFRQSKVIFDYMETIWNNAPRLRSICKIGGSNSSGPFREPDKLTMRIGPNWACAIPVGNGEKIRGLRSNLTIMDEFNSVPLSIYETVIQGFGSVSINPIEIVKREAKKRKMFELGFVNSMDELDSNEDKNKTIISGTAGYDFEHFADYWRKYKAIIESKGDIEKLKIILGGEIPRKFDWRDFSIIRVPYELIPEGFMSDETIARAKATVHSGTFAKEYGAVFTKDSMGFFPRSLIESCVASESHINSGNFPLWCSQPFDPITRGARDKKYVIAVDPASEIDNFSIVILELYEEHARVVFCWTTNKKRYKEVKKAQLTKEDDFYCYCARKIRDLLKLFPSEHIAIDAQGGGIAVIESLRDKRNLYSGEIPILPIIDPDKPADTDIESGLHIVHPIQFAKYEWVAEANHGMKKDMQDKTLLFPRFDIISMEMAAAEDVSKIEQFERENPGKTITLYDTIEDCVLEVEELKDELTSIIVTKTGTGVNSRDRWDTPEIKTMEGKKGRMKKDRYSSLLMANMIARQLRVQKAQLEYGFGGLITDDDSSEYNENSLYEGPMPDWYKETMRQILG